MPDMKWFVRRRKIKGLYSNIFVLLFFEITVLGEIPVDLTPNILPASENEIAL